MDDADRYILRQIIASSIDHPSVYMGGPSPTAVRKAIRIVTAIMANYEVSPREAATKDSERVRTWRKSPWNSMSND